MGDRTRSDGHSTRSRHVVSIALVVCVTVALSLYYLATEDENRYGGKFTARYTTSSGGHRGYLVRGRKCRIQDVDPYDKEVRAFVRTVPYVPCSKVDPLTYVVKRDGYSELRVDRHAAPAYSPLGVSCCYSTVTRTWDSKKPDDSIAVSKCKTFTDSVNITEDFIIAKCVTKNRRKEVYKNAHAVVNIVPGVRKKMVESRPTAGNGSRALSVLMIGIDSISRLNMLRTMPRTTEYLSGQAGWVELKGYNKIADNTYPNLMAVLTGIDGDYAYEACLPKQLYRLDNCSMIWYRYRDSGYVTAYAEDEATISTFNFLKVGFVKPPTDYYLRPFIIAAQHELKTVEKYSLKYCLGPVSAGERILSYAKDFATTFVNHSNFGLFWMNSFSHNDLNFPSGMDHVMLKFFKSLTDAGVTENSIVVFFSDHGMRFGDVRQTKIGWLEERLPFIYVSVPGWFREEYPREFANLQVNANRLTTPYDLHMTLQDVLVMSGRADSVTQSTGCPRCKSLFSAIEADRSCEDVAVSPHWCMCTTFRAIDVGNGTVRDAALFVVSRIMRYVVQEGAADGGPDKCAKLNLNRILISQVGDSWDGSETYFLLFIETLPGRGKFEATVSLTTATANISDRFQLHSSISRLDGYAGQSRCMDNSFLKKYCYCR